IIKPGIDWEWSTTTSHFKHPYTITTWRNQLNVDVAGKGVSSGKADIDIDGRCARRNIREVEFIVILDIRTAGNIQWIRKALIYDGLVTGQFRSRTKRNFFTANHSNITTLNRRRQFVLDQNRAPAAVTGFRISNGYHQRLTHSITAEQYTAKARTIASNSYHVIIVAAIRTTIEDHVGCNKVFAVLINRYIDIVVACQR